MIPRRQFRDFFCGRGGKFLAVAKIHTEMSVFMSAQTDTVRMAKSYAEKMLVKHRLTFEHLRIVQDAIDQGACFVGKKANHLEYVYFDNDYKKSCFLLVIKSARFGQEVWFVSLYRLRDKQAKMIKQEQRLLRDFLTGVRAE